MAHQLINRRDGWSVQIRCPKDHFLNTVQVFDDDWLFWQFRADDFNLPETERRVRANRPTYPRQVFRCAACPTFRSEIRDERFDELVLGAFKTGQRVVRLD